VYDVFSRKLVEALKNIKLGFGNDPQADMGCLIDIANRDRIAGLVEQAGRSERVLLKGSIPDGALKDGAFISPSLIEVQDLDSPFIQQELFGPLLVIERFADEQEALRRANATRYSLASSVWTLDGTKAR